jgi:methionine-rich copper-binding protein CopC
MMSFMTRLVLALALGLAAQPALAHSELKRTMPAAGTVLDQPPAEVVLHFNEKVQVTTLRLLDEQGRRIALATDGSFDPGEVERAGVPALVPGRYRIDWAAISADGHPISGQVPFTIRAQPQRPAP